MEDIEYADFDKDTQKYLRLQNKKNITNLTVNIGGDKRDTDLRKTLWLKERADGNTVILTYSYDFIEDHLKVDKEEHKNYGDKFVKFGGLARLITELYNTGQMNENERDSYEVALDLANHHAIPRHFVLHRLPDGGEKYRKRRKKAKNNPTICPRQMILDKDFMDSKSLIGYEENPHDRLNRHLTLPFHHKTSKNKETVLHLIQKWQKFYNDEVVSSGEDNLEIGRGTLHMVKEKLKELQEELDRNYEDTEETNPDQTKVVDPQGQLHQVFFPDTEFESKTEEIHQPFQYLFDQVRKEFEEVMRILDSKDRTDDLIEISELYHNLSVLAKMDQMTEYDILANWRKSRDNKGNVWVMGNCIFNEDKEAMITISRQYLQELYDTRHNVVVNYAGAKEDLLREKIGEDWEKFEIEVPEDDNLTTELHHIDVPLAEWRMSETKRNKIKLIKQLHQLQGRDVGSITYSSYESDFTFGERGVEHFGNVWQVIGTPRVNDYVLAKEYFNHFGRFPYCLERNSNYGVEIPKKLVNSKQGMQTGFDTDSKALREQREVKRLNKARNHLVENKKKDGFHRMREQYRGKKILENFGQMSDPMKEGFPESQIKRHSSLNEYIVHRLKELAESDIDPQGMNMEYDIAAIPDPLYRKSGRLYRKDSKDTADEISEKEGKSITEITKEVGCHRDTVVSKVEKSENMKFEKKGKEKVLTLC